MFMGVVDTNVDLSGYDITNVDDTTKKNVSTTIRNLNKVSKEAAKGTQTITATSGNKSIIWPYPKALTTSSPTFKYKLFGNYESLSGV